MTHPSCSGTTRRGLDRSENQDAVRCCDPETPAAAAHGYLYALADGMGGYQRGDLASQDALDQLFEAFYSSPPGRPLRNLRDAMDRVNMHVCHAARRLAMRMGTTLTAVHVGGDRLSIAHVGDSRAYLVRRGIATLLTQDHTRVGDLVRMGLLPPTAVRNHSERSVLSRCIGLELFVQIDVTQARLQQGDKLVLCSDGVWSVIEDDELGALAAQACHPETLSDGLVSLARERESGDDCSAVAVCIDCPLTPCAETEGGHMRRLARAVGKGVLGAWDD